MESMETVEEQIATEELINRAFALGAIQVREEITAFVQFLRGRKLRNIMEIGSESGGTFYLWCRLASLGGLKISLDKPDGASGSWRFVPSEELEKRTRLFQSFAPRVKVVTGDSHSPAVQSVIDSILGEEKLDLLFIDGDHSYEGVRADYEMYREFVAPGGIIAFHDIQHLGPEQLWKELIQHRGQTPMMEFNSHLHWAGIGLVQV